MLQSWAILVLVFVSAATARAADAGRAGADAAKSDVTMADAAKGIVDNFTEPKLPVRKPMRGDWKIGDGVARCTQDDELYKKNKDHGPIIWYQTPFKDATIRFAFKPNGTKTFVFTINGEKGHVFRFVKSQAGTTVLVFPPESPDHKSLPLSRDNAPLKSGEWTDVTIAINGTRADLKIGDYTATVDHPAIAQEKTTVGLGFSFGTMTIKNFSLKP